MHGLSADKNKKLRNGGGLSLTNAVHQWATPSAQQFEAVDLDRLLSRQARQAEKNGNNGFGLPLANQVQLWATPRSAMSNALGNPKHLTPRRGSGNIEDQVANWSTPKGDLPLPSQASQWSTPSAHDGRRPGEDLRSTQGRNLNREAATWPSPTTRIFKGGGQAVTRADGKSRLDMLDWKAEAWIAPSPSSVPDPLTSDGQRSLTPIPFSPLPSETSIDGGLLAEISVYRRWSMRSGGAAGWRGTWTRQPRRQLNPRFVEWLMRWPDGWSAFDCSATASTPWWDGMRGFTLTLSTARAESASVQGMLL